MSNKTAMMRLYDMLDKGQISEIAEIKEYFMMLEREQHSKTWNASLLGYWHKTKSHFKHDEDFDEYYNETYKGGEQ